MMTPKCEVLINFAYISINKHISNPAIPDDNITELFGTDDWKKISEIGDPIKRRIELHSLYERQLIESAGIRFVRSFEMINKHNNISYYLFFGTNHIAGLRAMKHAMWKVDPTGNFAFSDRTFGQITFFSNGPDLKEVKDIILSMFRGRQVTIDQIINFILENTSFLDTHIKGVLKTMEYADPPELIVLSKRWRKGTFPPGTLIRFL